MPSEQHESDSDNYPAGTGNQIAADEGGDSNPSLSLIAAMFEPPHSPTTQNPPTQQPEKWYKDRKFMLEVLAFAVLVAYTVFSCLQWLQIRWTNRMTREALDGSSYSLTQTLGKMQDQIDAAKKLYGEAQKQTAESHKLAETARKTYDNSNRPYVGVAKVEASFIGPDGKGGLTNQTKCSPDTYGMKVSADLKNFGALPGTHTNSGWAITVGGVETKKGGASSTDEVIFPTQSFYFKSWFYGAEYTDISHGTTPVIVDVWTSYDGPSGHYKYCTRSQYVANTCEFVSSGTTCSPEHIPK